MASTSSSSQPRRNASAMAKSRSSVAWRSATSSSISLHTWQLRPRSPCAPTSRERIAFWRADSNVRPMAITSPVAFICVPTVRSAVTNLSKGQRGIFTTQ